MTVRTDIFSGTPLAYVRRVGVQILWHRWWAWLTPVVACFMAAAWEAVWIFVAFMLLFMLYPGLVLLVYYYYAFSPEALRTLEPRTVELTDGAITVTYHGERHIEPQKKDCYFSVVRAMKETVHGKRLLFLLTQKEF